MDQVQWNIFQAELLNVAQTSRLYFAALYQKELYELAQEAAELNERLLNAAERRFKVNLAKAADVTAAQVARADGADRPTWPKARARRRCWRNAAAIRSADERSRGAHREIRRIPVAIPAVRANRWRTIVNWRGNWWRAGPTSWRAQAGMKVSLANLGLARSSAIPDIQARRHGPNGGRHYEIPGVPLADGYTDLEQRRAPDAATAGGIDSAATDVRTVKGSKPAWKPAKCHRPVPSGFATWPPRRPRRGPTPCHRS